MVDLPVGTHGVAQIPWRIDNGEVRGGDTTQPDNLQCTEGWMEGWMAFVVGVTFIRDHGHAHGSRRSELTNYLGENPGGNLGTAQANPCCWLTPTGP